MPRVSAGLCLAAALTMLCQTVSFSFPSRLNTAVSTIHHKLRRRRICSLSSPPMVDGNKRRSVKNGRIHPNARPILSSLLYLSNASTRNNQTTEKVVVAVPHKLQKWRRRWALGNTNSHKNRLGKWLKKFRMKKIEPTLLFQQQRATSTVSVSSSVSTKVWCSIITQLRANSRTFQSTTPPAPTTIRQHQDKRWPIGILRHMMGLIFCPILFMILQPMRAVALSLSSSSSQSAINPNAVVSSSMMMERSATKIMTPIERRQLITLTCLWVGIFIILALLHAAEIAITTLYPWKVREIAEEEEKQGKKSSVFKTLNDDITRVLTTILVTSTAASIFATTLFTHIVASTFGTRGERYGALALTGLTLFFVELLPKSFGVTNAEVVARVMVPPVNIASKLVSPLGITLSWLAKRTLLLMGVRPNKDGDGVSDSQLRLIVTGARDSGTIDPGEQEMIQGVLNLQNQRVKEIMRPRVEMIAVPKDMSVVSVLGAVRESGYSRIPVYEGEIDNIVGIVLAKSVLDFFVRGVLIDEDLAKKISKNYEDASRNGEDDEAKDSDDATETRTSSDNADAPMVPRKTRAPPPVATVPVGGDDRYVRTLTASELATRMETSISDAGLIESCYFVPDTANGWSVLQEMRKRRVHVAIVVDEYGGTEGLVSLEDIVEEVVGEIYDEDDTQDFEFSEDSITMQSDGSFNMRGDADLSDVDTILSLDLTEDDLKEFATISGYLCMCAGQIPSAGDFIMCQGWCFEVANADDKKILQVRVERLTGGLQEEHEGRTTTPDNPFLNLLKKKQVKSSLTVETASTVEPEDTKEVLTTTVDDAKVIHPDAVDEAKSIERMVESSERKRGILEAIKNEAEAKDDEDTS